MVFSCLTTILIGPPCSFCKVVKIVKIYKIKKYCAIEIVLMDIFCKNMINPFTKKESTDLYTK